MHITWTCIEMNLRREAKHKFVCVTPCGVCGKAIEPVSTDLWSDAVKFTYVLRNGKPAHDYFCKETND